MEGEGKEGRPRNVLDPPMSNYPDNLSHHFSSCRTYLATETVEIFQVSLHQYTNSVPFLLTYCTPRPHLTNAPALV